MRLFAVILKIHSFLLFSYGQGTSVLEIEEVKLFWGEGYSNTFFFVAHKTPSEI